MAELHVQRKKNNYLWVWLLIVVLLIAAAVYWYMNYYQKSEEATAAGYPAATSSDTSYNEQHDAPTGTATVADSMDVSWQQIDFNSPDTIYAEVKSKSVTEKANKNYAIYSIHVPVLFVDNKSEMTTSGETALKEIGASINQRFKDADIKIYNCIDSSAKKENNQQLAEQRAEAVRIFLVNNSKVNEHHISVFPATQSSSVANQKSNRINIVAKR